MFREMRRKKQLLSKADSDEILYRNSAGVLALAGDGGYPYAVPVSYVYDGNRIYFHSAKSGHKIDALQREPRVSFCVVDEDHIVPEEYTTYFRSVIAFGTVRIMESEEEKRRAIEKLALKYAPDSTAADRKEAIERDWKPLCMLEMTIDHMTGKEAIELVRDKKKEQL